MNEGAFLLQVSRLEALRLVKVTRDITPGGYNLYLHRIYIDGFYRPVCFNVVFCNPTEDEEEQNREIKLSYVSPDGLIMEVNNLHISPLYEDSASMDETGYSLCLVDKAGRIPGAWHFNYYRGED